jgi:acetylornithine deacetylase/succinyl-diaminopimelate desuccinylase-like protein
VPKEILQHLRNHLDRHGFQDIEIIANEGTQAAKTDPDHPLVKKVMKAATKMKGIPPRVILMNPGSGPMYALCQHLGIPAIGFGVGNPDSRKHAPNENILIKDYLDGIKMAATVIHEWA